MQIKGAVEVTKLNRTGLDTPTRNHDPSSTTTFLSFLSCLLQAALFLRKCSLIPEQCKDDLDELYC